MQSNAGPPLSTLMKIRVVQGLRRACIIRPTLFPLLCFCTYFPHVQVFGSASVRLVTSAEPTVQAMRSVRSMSAPARGSASRSVRGSVRCANGVCSACPSSACHQGGQRMGQPYRSRFPETGHMLTGDSGCEHAWC